MEKITKKYLNVNFQGREWISKEVDFDDPELVDTKDITGFCFLEQSFVLDGEEIYEGKTRSVSPTYYVGTRISILDALEMVKNESEMTRNYFQNLAQKYPNVSVCKTELGYLEVMWDQSDITLDEYIAKKNKSKN